MNRKMEKKRSELEVIIGKLNNWDGRSQPELFEWIHTLEKFPRKERSTYYEPYFRDVDLALLLVSIAEKNRSEPKVLIDIVSYLGNCLNRYQLIPLYEIFELFYSLKEMKKVNYYVSLFILRFPQFQVLEERWVYLLSLPTIAPKEKSRQNFYCEVKASIQAEENIPKNYKQQLIEQLTLFLEQEGLHVIDRDNYLQLIADLEG